MWISMKRGKLRRIEQALSAADGIKIDAGRPHGVTQCLPVGRARQTQVCVAEPAEHRIGPEPGLAEPGALFGAEREDLDRARRHQPGALEVNDYGQTGDDTRGTVEVAALRHRIQMRAAGDGGLFRLPPRQGND